MSQMCFLTMIVYKIGLHCSFNGCMRAQERLHKVQLKLATSRRRRISNSYERTVAHNSCDCLMYPSIGRRDGARGAIAYSDLIPDLYFVWGIWVF